jgi:putative membrane protein
MEYRDAVRDVVLKFGQRWLVTTFAVLIAALLLDGIHYRSAWWLAGASLLLGLLNAFVRPVLMVLALPLVIWSLGLFILVINALLLLAVGAMLAPGFRVEGFWSAAAGALIISIVSFIANLFLGQGSFIRVQSRSQSRPKGRDDDQGPVIDV